MALADDSVSLSERYAQAMARSGRKPMCPVLTTQRLRLRMPRPDDLDFLTALDTDEQVMRYIHSGPLRACEARVYAAALIQLAPMRAQLHRWIIENPGQTLRIGWIELSKYEQERKRELSDDVQLSYEISPEFWQQGYTTEAAGAVLEYAFATIELDRLVAFARPENVKSLRVIDKLGFLPDGDCTDGAENVCSFYFLPRESWRRRLVNVR